MDSSSRNVDSMKSRRLTQQELEHLKSSEEEAELLWSLFDWEKRSKDALLACVVGEPIKED